MLLEAKKNLNFFVKLQLLEFSEIIIMKWYLVLSFMLIYLVSSQVFFDLFYVKIMAILEYEEKQEENHYFRAFSRFAIPESPTFTVNDDSGAQWPWFVG